LVAAHQKGTWDYVSTVAVVLTLIVLVWYTLETYKLRKAAQDQTAESGDLLREAQRQNETSLRLVEQAQRQNEATAKLVEAAQRQNESTIMPILAVRIDPPESYFATSNPRQKSKLVLSNEGTGPAFNLSIEPYSVQDRELTLDHGSEVIAAGEERELIFHLQEGIKGVSGNLNELYSWINTGHLPNPLSISLQCVSLSSTNYKFTFRFTPIAGKLAVLLERMDSTPPTINGSI
jgi:hypothetical protein